MEKPIEKFYTKNDILKGLYELGIRRDMILEVHSSLSSFGHVIGGAQAVVDALMEIVGDGGTILMPSQTGDNSEPSAWMYPPITPDGYKIARENIPAYDKLNSELRGMGTIVENFRRRRGVIMSAHPSCSYLAWGRYAKLLTNHQSLHFSLSEESPSARLYELKGKVLLLGVGFEVTTCMHLAEYRADCRAIVINGAAIETSSGTTWKKYLDVDLDSQDFLQVEKMMRANNAIVEGKVCESNAKFFSANVAVDTAVNYFERTVPYDLYR